MQLEPATQAGTRWRWGTIGAVLGLSRRRALLMVAVPIAFFCVLLFATPNGLSVRERVTGCLLLVAFAGPLLYVRLRNT